jgi:hypothetical protein
VTYSANCGDALALDDLEWGALEEPANYREAPEVTVIPETEHAQIARERGENAMSLPALDEGQQSALAAVCATYLSTTRGVFAATPPMLTEEAIAEIKRRRAVCTLITGGAE